LVHFVTFPAAGLARDPSSLSAHHALLIFLKDRFMAKSVRELGAEKDASNFKRRFKSEVQQCSIDDMAE
jgi:hypothetical protein